MHEHECETCDRIQVWEYEPVDWAVGISGGGYRVEPECNPGLCQCVMTVEQEGAYARDLADMMAERSAYGRGIDI